jgi:3D (Asp-Asp-Asp) domain-containing protein
MGANAADLFYIGGGGSSNLNANDELYGYDDHSKLLYSYLSTGSKHVGAISSVLMYQRALTELEVKQNFNALRGRYSSYSSGGGSSIVTENLVLNLDAGNNSSYGGSGTTWTDLSGQNNNGTINGATYNSGDGGYFIFDGTNDRVSLPAGSDFAYGTGDFTIESWFNVTGTSPQTWGEIAFSQTVSGTNYFIAYISSGNPVLKKPTFTYGTGGGTPIVSSTAYTEDTWYHYVVTRNGTTLTMYLNNSVVATDTVSFNFNNTTYVPTIGAYTHSDNHNLDGKISIVRVYKGKGFSASDVTQNYFAVKSRYGY